MCGRYTNTTDADQIVAALEFTGRPDPATVGRFNIAPTQEVLAGVERDGELETRTMRWGLIPRWSGGPDDKRVGGRMINARVETVWERPAFARLARDPRRRCLIAADGFYEWRAPERPKAPKLAVHFSLSEREPFAFAGLNDLWWPSREDTRPPASPAVPPLRSCTIIVGPATQPVEAIHDRQPVILDTPERRRAWLDPSLSEADLAELLAPLPAGRLHPLPVGSWVNDPDHEGERCLEPEQDEAEQTPTLFG
jgi:putative SOS response-associated peptidase YedK